MLLGLSSQLNGFVDVKMSNPKATLTDISPEVPA
jgi:hypothetical protein